jgi:hypothetical protein
MQRTYATEQIAEIECINFKHRPRLATAHLAALNASATEA